MKLLIVSGLSGSGKSVALKTLEDEGYYCVDNLPANLLTNFVSEFRKNRLLYSSAAAIGIDARANIENIQQIPEHIKKLTNKGITVDLLFISASDTTLLKRFSETRRKHPLSQAQRPLLESIEYERDILSVLSNIATTSIDTSELSTPTFKQKILDEFALDPHNQSSEKLSLLFQSFGFKYGIPNDTNFIFDVRCLPNPHWQAELRPLTGQDAPVQEFLIHHTDANVMIKSIIDFVEKWLPQFEAEHRKYMTISIGCTGGQHRSVFIAEALEKHFSQNRTGVNVRHKELLKHKKIKPS